MSVAADGNPKVRALVYIASFLLDEGESTGELAGKFPGNELGPALRPVPVAGLDGHTVNDLYVQQERFREVFAADVGRVRADRRSEQHLVGDVAPVGPRRRVQRFNLRDDDDRVITSRRNVLFAGVHVS